MVNLEEIKENQGKKEYVSPELCVKYLTWEDIVTNSQSGNEAPTPVVTPGEVDLGELEDNP